ncbi:P4R3B phosphatase, partial [Smithornis capensis]|nr:P4R3B phosphatase [Smithornis capensis]
RRAVDLPPCEIQRLGEIANLVTSVRRSRVRKEKLAQALKKEGYIPKLLQLFQVCENLKDTKALHLLFDIVRGILYLDEAILFEVMFSDEYVLDVFGCLEYDPCLAQPQKHRELLLKIAKLQEAIPIKDHKLRKKIYQMSRARFIRNIILPNPSDFEEGFLSTLTSFIRCSKEEILNMLQKNKIFLPGIFAKLKDEVTDDQQRCELMIFFKEFCAFSLSLRTKRDKFLDTLAKLEILPTLEILLGMKDLQVRSAATDILSYLLYFRPSMVQDFVMQEALQGYNDTQLLVLIIEQMIYHPDPGLGGDNQYMEILCTLTDPENMLDKFSRLEIFGFLDFFYDCCIDVLTAPLLDHTSGGSYLKGKEKFNFFLSLVLKYFEGTCNDYHTAEILASILELLSFCVEQHKYHMKKYVIKKDLLRSVLILLKSKHKFLALCALRFMRKIIGLKDDLYNNYITLKNLFEPVINALLDNRTRYNMLNSALLELFEFIRVEDIQFLIAHIVENFSGTLDSIKYVQTFQEFKTRYEQEKNQKKEKQIR